MTLDKIAYNYAEAAYALGVSQKFISNAVARGELRSIRKGGRRLIPADSLRKYAETSDDDEPAD